MRFPLVLVLAIIAAVAPASAFDVSPASPMPGDTITIRGASEPGSEVRLKTSFTMNLPVTDGSFQYIAQGVEIPQKPNRVAVTVRGVEDLNLGVKVGIWITKGLEAKDGTASVSQSDVPPGRYDLKVFGQAVEGASAVNLEIKAETSTKTGHDGAYSLQMSTSGIPEGEYRIDAGGESRVIRIGSPVGSGESGESGGSGESGESGSSTVAGSSEDRAEYNPPAREQPGIPITREVVKWYAGKVGLDPEDPEQLARAEESLKERTSERYWIVIARGDPLTEQAGNCEEEYCLVRWADACRSCREKDKLINRSSGSGTDDGGMISPPVDAPENEDGPVIDPIDPIGAAQPRGEEKGLFEALMDLIQRFLAPFTGG